MKNVLAWTIAIAITIALTAAVIFSTRYLTNATTPITLHKPVDGVSCAVMTTSDGAAISCWKD